MTRTVKVDMGQFNTWQHNLLRLKDRFMPAAQRGVLSGAQRCIPYLVNQTDEKAAVDTGMYRASWKAERIVDGARVYNSKAYAPVIEEGRRAGPVSLQGVKRIESWAHRKLGIPKQHAESVAWAIASKMREKDRPGKYVMGESEEEMYKLVLAEIMHELDAEWAAL